MRKKVHRTRSRKSSRLHQHYRHGKRCASHRRSHQKPHKATRASYIASLIGLAMYVLLATILAIACFITQSYTMLPIVNVMVHELGYMVRHMIESTCARRRNKRRVVRGRRNLWIPIQKRAETIARPHGRPCSTNAMPSTSMAERIDP